MHFTSFFLSGAALAASSAALAFTPLPAGTPGNTTVAPPTLSAPVNTTVIAIIPLPTGNTTSSNTTVTPPSVPVPTLEPTIAIPPTAAPTSPASKPTALTNPNGASMARVSGGLIVAVASIFVMFL